VVASPCRASGPARCPRDRSPHADRACHRSRRSPAQPATMRTRPRARYRSGIAAGERGSHHRRALTASAARRVPDRRVLASVGLGRVTESLAAGGSSAPIHSGSRSRSGFEDASRSEIGCAFRFAPEACSVGGHINECSAVTHRTSVAGVPIPGVGVIAGCRGLIPMSFELVVSAGRFVASRPSTSRSDPAWRTTAGSPPGSR
jgi:hypothetical protein